MDLITCPHCSKSFPMSDAIKHELEEKVKIEQRAKLKAEFEREKAEENAKQEKRLREEFEKLNKERASELLEAKKKETELSEKLAKEKEERGKSEEKIKEDTLKEASEKSRLDKLEYEKKISDMQKALEDAQRKGKQGSQQLQGEVLELDLEEKLRKLFPNDQFLPVPKGVEGGDIWQKVKFNGSTVGSILWETKRTKAWSNSWTTKLKHDAGKINASESIIVSITLPEGTTNFDRKDGVWITTYEHAISICRYVRFLITTVASVKSSVGQSEEEWGQIRDYMMSDSFKHRMQAHFDGIKSLRDSLDAEKRSTILRWKKSESQIEKLDTNTTNFYGELKAIVKNLPEVDDVDSPLLEDGNEENKTLL